LAGCEDGQCVSWEQGRQSKKNSAGLKGSKGETCIRVQGGVLLGDESSQKL